MIRIAAAAAAVLAAVCSPAAAGAWGDRTEYSYMFYDCIRATADRVAAIDACVTDELSRADEALNLAYADTMGRLEPGERERLRRSERAWISTRDHDCAAVAEAYRDPSYTRVAQGYCLLDATIDRTNYLLRFGRS